MFPNAPLDVRATGPPCWMVMKRTHPSDGKALCRYCGEHIAINRLSLHIARMHPRPAPIDRTPTLVPKSAAPKKRPNS